MWVLGISKQFIMNQQKNEVRCVGIENPDQVRIKSPSFLFTVP